MYRRFVDEYMPGRPETIDKTWTRAEVLDAALKKFDVQEEYDEKITAHKNEQAEANLWKEIKDLIPLSDILRKTVIKGLHRFVMFNSQHQPVFLLQPAPPEIQPRWSNFVNDDTRPDLLEWVKANWKEAHDRERNAAVMNGHHSGPANLH